MRDPKLSLRRQGDALAVGAGLAFLSFCLPRLRHSYDYDESVTVGFFVRQSDFLDAVTSQRVFNNHPLLTAVNWIVYRLGGESEAWQRVAPVAAGVACVVILVGWCARRWGRAAGAGAALVTATNPLLVSLSSQARGYSLAALVGTLSTLLVIEGSRKEGVRPVAYAALVTVGLLSHLYIAIVFAGHGAVLARHGAESTRIWFRAGLTGGLLAVLAYSPMLHDMLTAARSRDGAFVGRFPLQVADAAFGYRWVAILAGFLMLGVCISSHHARVFCGTTGGLVLVVWVVLQPFDLYPRFLVWAIPLLGLAAGLLVSREPRWLLPVLVVGVASAWATIDDAGSESDIRAVASTGRSYERAGFDVCVAGFYWESYVAYAVFEPAAAQQECDLVIVRRSDLENPTVVDRSFAAMPGTTGSCLAASPGTLRSVGLEPGTCD